MYVYISLLYMHLSGFRHSSRDMASVVAGFIKVSVATSVRVRNIEHVNRNLKLGEDANLACDDLVSKSQ